MAGIPLALTESMVDRAQDALRRLGLETDFTLISESEASGQLHLLDGRTVAIKLARGAAGVWETNLAQTINLQQLDQTLSLLAEWQLMRFLPAPLLKSVQARLERLKVSLDDQLARVTAAELEIPFAGQTTIVPELLAIHDAHVRVEARYAGASPSLRVQFAAVARLGAAPDGIKLAGTLPPQGNDFLSPSALTGMIVSLAVSETERRLEELLTALRLGDLLELLGDPIAALNTKLADLSVTLPPAPWRLGTQLTSSATATLLPNILTLSDVKLAIELFEAGDSWGYGGGMSAALTLGQGADAVRYRIALPVRNETIDLDNVTFALEEGQDPTTTAGALLRALHLDAVLNLLPDAFARLPLDLNASDLSLAAGQVQNVSLVARVNESFTLPLPIPGAGGSGITFAAESLRAAWSAGAWSVTISGNAQANNSMPGWLQRLNAPFSLTVSSAQTIVALEHRPLEIPGLNLGLLEMGVTIERTEIHFPTGGEALLVALITIRARTPVSKLVQIVKERLRAQIEIQLSAPVDQAVTIRLAQDEWPLTFGELAAAAECAGPGDFRKLDLGIFGFLCTTLPHVRYNGSSFAATGEIRRYRSVTLPLKYLLPLKTLRSLIEKIGLDDALKLPDDLPLLPSPSEVYLTRALGPDAYDAYFPAPEPDLRYELVVSPEGGLSVGAEVAVKGEEIRALSGPFGMHLCTLKTLQIGPLTFLKVDADADFFLYPSHIMAAYRFLHAIPGADNLLVDPDKLRFRVVAQNALILLSTVIPIPIFFDNLAIDYLGVEGLGFESSWSFKGPTDTDEVVSVLAPLVPFLTNPRVRLNEADLAGVDLKLEANPALGITLPPWLGGTTIKIVIALAAKSSVVHLLNFLKSQHLADLIMIAPLHMRSFELQPTFLGITLTAAAMFVTWEEFVARPPGYATFEAAVQTAVAAQHPLSAQTVLLLLDAGVGLLGGKVDFHAAIIQDDHSFLASIGLRGELPGDLAALDLNGSVALSLGKERHFAIKMAGSLQIFGHTIGEVQGEVSDQRLLLTADIRIFSFAALGVGLEIAANGHFSASAMVDFLGQQASLDFTHEHFQLSAKLLGVKTKIELRKEGSALQLWCKLDWNANLSFKVDTIKEPRTGLTLLPGFSLDAHFAIDGSFSVGEGGARANFALTFKFGAIDFKVVVDTSDLVAFFEDAAKYVERLVTERAYDIFAVLFISPMAWLSALADWANDRFDAFVNAIGSMMANAGEAFVQLVQVSGVALATMGAWIPQAWNVIGGLGAEALRQFGDVEEGILHLASHWGRLSDWDALAHVGTLSGQDLADAVKRISTIPAESIGNLVEFVVGGMGDLGTPDFKAGLAAVQSKAQAAGEWSQDAAGKVGGWFAKIDPLKHGIPLPAITLDLPPVHIKKPKWL